MNESPDSPVPYHVSYSETVRRELLSFADQARAHGLGGPLGCAADRRLGVGVRIDHSGTEATSPPARLASAGITGSAE